MFLGHFAVALAASRAEPRLRLGTAFMAAQLPDVLWPWFLLAGVERVLHMEDELERLRLRMERMEQEMRRSLDEVHRYYRRDLVLYRPPQPPSVRPEKKRT